MNMSTFTLNPICWGKRFCAVMAFALLAIPQIGFSQSCISFAEVALDDNCQFELTLSNVCTGNCTGTVRLKGQPDAIIDGPGIYGYVVMNGNTKVCEGQVEAKDNSAPEVEICNFFEDLDPLNCLEMGKYTADNFAYIRWANLGADETCEEFQLTDEYLEDECWYLTGITYEDNCLGDDLWVDVNYVVIKNDCEDSRGFGDDVHSIIRQTFTVSDGNLSTSKSVDIPFKRVESSDLDWGKWDDGQTILCGVDCGTDLSNYDPFNCLDLPTFTNCDGEEITVTDELAGDCGLFYQREVLSKTLICNNTVLKARIRISLLDWCGEELDAYTVNVEVGNFTEPDLNVEPVVISTGVMDCTAAFTLRDAEDVEDVFDVDFGELCGEVKVVSVQFESCLDGFPGDYFTGDRYQTFNFPSVNGTYYNISVGRHRAIITLEYGCKNNIDIELPFIVKDLIAPSMACDDEINLTLSNDPIFGSLYGLIQAEDAQEGTWDNCHLGRILIRRNLSDNLDALNSDPLFVNKYDHNNDGVVDKDDDVDGDAFETLSGKDEVYWDGEQLFTEWREFVDYFCADLGADVKAEVYAEDRAYMPGCFDPTQESGIIEDMPMPNSNTCWLDVNVEQKLVPQCAGNTSEDLDCNDPALDVLVEGTFEEGSPEYEAIVDEFGFPSFIGLSDCVPAERTITVVYGEDASCGDGTIRIDYTVTTANSKDDDITVTCSHTLNLVGLRNYSICFPADLITECLSGDADTAVQVTVLDGSCGEMIGIWADVIEFSQGSDACNKMEITHYVANWCELGELDIPLSRNLCAIEVPRPQEVAGSNYQEGDKAGIIRNTNGNLGYDYNCDGYRPFVPGSGGKGGSGSSGDIYDGLIGTGTLDNDGTWPFSFTVFGLDYSYYQCNASNLGKWDYDDSDEGYKLGYYAYTQVIKIIDNDAPLALPLESLDCFEAVDGCQADVQIPFCFDDCDDNSGLELVSIILVTEGGATLDQTELESLFGLQPIVNDGSGCFLIDAEDLPVGAHRFVVRVKDPCGNISSPLNVPFEICDVKAPVPVCYNGLTVTLMPTADSLGMGEIWANDFVKEVQGGCPGEEEEITYYMILDSSLFGTPGFEDDIRFDPEREDPDGMFFDCNDYNALIENSGTPEGVVIPIQVYTEDESGNTDACLTYVLLQEGVDNICTETFAANDIEGAISTEGNEPVEDVDVELSGDSETMVETNSEGTFQFEGLPVGGDYTVKPVKQDDLLNGVSTFDLVLMQKHILGVQLLDSPYKMISADVNGSQSITTLDMINLRKVILNIDTEFSNNSSWRFIHEDYTFPEVNDPWRDLFPEVYSINNLPEGEAMTAGFIAVKIGDVNGNAIVNNAMIEPRSVSGSLKLQLEDATLEKGEEFTVNFSAEDLRKIDGYQFALQLGDGLELIDLIYGIAGEESFGIFTDKNLITTSWVGEANDGVLFSLVVRATQPVQLSEAIGLSDRHLRGEAYTKAGELQDIAIAFDGKVNSATDFALYQNTPNPFAGETTIGFDLPEAGTATLVVQDVAGKTLQVISGEFAKGYNTITLDASDLPATGLLYYSLKAGEFTATQKMIIVE